MEFEEDVESEGVVNVEEVTNKTLVQSLVFSKLTWLKGWPTRLG